jgi:hypothetical protein
MTDRYPTISWPPWTPPTGVLDDRAPLGHRPRTLRAGDDPRRTRIGRLGGAFAHLQGMCGPGLASDAYIDTIRAALVKGGFGSRSLRSGRAARPSAKNGMGRALFCVFKTHYRDRRATVANHLIFMQIQFSDHTRRKRSVTCRASVWGCPLFPSSHPLSCRWRITKSA